MQRRRRRGHKGAGRQAKVLPAQVAAGAAPASARPLISSNPLVPKSNGAAEGARRGRGAECRGRNHFRGSVHTCRDESLTTETVAACASSLGDAKSCTRFHAPDSRTRHVHERGGKARGRAAESASVSGRACRCRCRLARERRARVLGVAGHAATWLAAGGHAHNTRAHCGGQRKVCYATCRQSAARLRASRARAPRSAGRHRRRSCRAAAAGPREEGHDVFRV